MLCNGSLGGDNSNETNNDGHVDGRCPSGIIYLGIYLRLSTVSTLLLFLRTRQTNGAYLETAATLRQAAAAAVSQTFDCETIHHMPSAVVSFRFE